MIWKKYSTHWINLSWEVFIPNTSNLKITNHKSQGDYLLILITIDILWIGTKMSISEFKIVWSIFKGYQDYYYIYGNKHILKAHYN